MIFCVGSGADVVSVADGARDYLQHLVVERGLAANTVESYRRDLNRYAEVLAARGKTEFNDVTAVDVAEFRAALRDRRRKSSAARRHLGRPRGRRGPRAARVRPRSGPGRRRPGPRGRAATAAAAAAQGDHRRRDRAAARRGRIDRRSRSAGAARPRAARVPLRDRGADLRGDRPRRRRPRPPGSATPPSGSAARAASSATSRSAATRSARSTPIWCAGVPPSRPPPSRRSSPAVFLNARGGRAHPAGRVGGATRSRGPFGENRRFTPYPAALLRHPSPRRGRRHPRRAGIARTRLRHHDCRSTL